MVRHSVTRLEASGYRFIRRRMEYALACRDTRMLDDPIRSQAIALTAGVVLAAIVLAACAVLALLRPHGSLGTAPVVMVRESGALYVRVGDTMHPAPNLASARLITGAPGLPRLVSAQMIAGAKQGPAMGIPGAPETIAPALEPDRATWTVCDEAAGRTVVLIGPPADLPVAEPVLVTAAQERAPGVYLLHAGRRAAVDLRDHAAVRALRLDGVVPRTVSAALLDVLPEAPPIGAPRIPGAGGPGPVALPDFRVGEVLRVPRAEGADHYVVLADGVQRVGRVAADLIRFAGTHADKSIPDVAASRLAPVPVLQTLAVTDLSETAPVGTTDGVLCARWHARTGTPAPDTTVLTSATLPAPRSFDLAQADGDGPRIDAVAVPAGRSAYVRAAGVAGDGVTTGPRYLVTGAGVAYGIGDDRDAVSLGLPPAPGVAPWPLLALLPRGPELSATRAAVVRDSLGVPS
ncbi:type VII secretion protein EccB [Mycolicibacterium diernhoferi]|uniref:Type VII secretion protein EccB n=2 Tax=Mycolicibacterium diernhoferi TaxID=1801 RepID=A0A1Q4HES5_9MYCO|nr:type VII secretion protein EccB [Mycolicibacterium diernhoferi]OJZ66049.1 type VII secretion protein EccB [Mycolicibacterium diernhoferi]PEG54588.1 type VII secretion protein EccB [Mycolicibacterium diernhoferi]QYL23957.1 type VII secretion protein EccB [Mycolicibacterium diernhoferi]